MSTAGSGMAFMFFQRLTFGRPPTKDLGPVPVVWGHLSSSGPSTGLAGTCTKPKLWFEEATAILNMLVLWTLQARVYQQLHRECTKLKQRSRGVNLRELLYQAYADAREFLIT